MVVETNIYRVLKPCGTCPFIDDGESMYLQKGRVQQIKDDLLKGGHFVCHKTVYDLDTDMEFTSQNQSRKMCAGAYNFLKKANKPNTAMQIAKRLGIE